LGVTGYFRMIRGRSGQVKETSKKDEVKGGRSELDIGDGQVRLVTERDNGNHWVGWIKGWMGSKTVARVVGQGTQAQVQWLWGPKTTKLEAKFVRQDVWRLAV